MKTFLISVALFCCLTCSAQIRQQQYSPTDTIVKLFYGNTDAYRVEEIKLDVKESKIGGPIKLRLFRFTESDGTKSCYLNLIHHTFSLDELDLLIKAIAEIESFPTKDTSDDVKDSKILKTVSRGFQIGKKEGKKDKWFYRNRYNIIVLDFDINDVEYFKSMLVEIKNKMVALSK